MNTFNGLSFARVPKWKKQESKKDRVMIVNFFIFMVQIESFGISGMMEESCHFFFFLPGLAIFSFSTGATNPSLG